MKAEKLKNRLAELEKRDRPERRIFFQDITEAGNKLGKGQITENGRPVDPAEVGADDVLIIFEDLVKRPLNG